MSQNGILLSADHLATLQAALHAGSQQASRALEQWLGKLSLIEIDSLVQMPLDEATSILGEGETPMLFGAMHLTGSLTGQMILAFDEASGRSLVEMLVDSSSEASSAAAPEEWSELATSAVLETTNIVCCAYLNALASLLTNSNQRVSLVPSAPELKQEYPQCLLQFALMGQAVAGDHALVARTRFEVNDTPLNWTLLFLPDAASLLKLEELLDPRNGIA